MSADTEQLRRRMLAAARELLAVDVELLLRLGETEGEARATAEACLAAHQAVFLERIDDIEARLRRQMH